MFLWGTKKAKEPPKPCEHKRRAIQDATLVESGIGETASNVPEIEPVQNTIPIQNTGLIQPGVEKSAGTSPEVVPAQDIPIVTTDTNQPCSICREEKLAARRYRWKIILGLFFPYAIQALDLTIVAGALPFIASDFRKLP